MEEDCDTDPEIEQVSQNVGIIQPDDFPGYTTWESRKHCCCTMNYIPKIGEYFWGSCEFSLCPSVPVMIILYTSLVLYCISIAKYYLWWNILIIPYFITFVILFTYAYMKTIFVGPGYLPFYWSMSGEEFSGLDCPPDGIISSEDQLLWTRAHPKPGRTIVAKTARRLVVRPDHLCGWVGTWIGKKNYKFFTLFNMYGVLYLIPYTIISGYMSFKAISNLKKFDILIFFQILFAVFALAFGMLTLVFTVSAWTNACQGVTSWESWNNIPPSKFDKGKCSDNVADVFGTVDQKWKWFLPYSPFENADINKLASEYPPYYC